MTRRVRNLVSKSSSLPLSGKVTYALIVLFRNLKQSSSDTIVKKNFTVTMVLNNAILLMVFDL